MSKEPAQKAAATPSQSDPSTSGAEEKTSRVVYIGHLPHGFFEDQLTGFFSQFGKLTRVRVSRNKKTGKAKHYAFLEFYSAEVAKIAAAAMDGYMMFTQKLQCRVMREDEVHPNLFKGANRKFKDIPWKKIEVERHNRERTTEEEAQRTARAVKRDQQRQKRIRDAGLDYEYEPLESLIAPKAKHTKFGTE